MHAIDLTIFALYLGLLGAIAWRTRRGASGGGQFFLAGRSVPWLPVGLSVMVTAFSGVNFVAFPSEVFANGLGVLAALPMFAIVAVPIGRWIIPALRGSGATSIYELLERRRGVEARLAASAIFLLWRLLWMGVALVATGRFLAAIVGADPVLVIGVAGVVATCYTAVGGMRAVIWTDVVQFAVIFGAVALAVGTAVAAVGLGEVLGAARDAGSFRPLAPIDAAYLSPDPRERLTLWSVLIGTAVAFSARYGADQVVTQRYLAARSLADARRGLWCNVVVVTVTLLLLSALGVALHSVEGEGGPVDRLAALRTVLPAGGAGLLAAGILAATMSSIDSGLNACLAAYSRDFGARLGAPAPATSLGLRLWTAWLGVIVVVLAFAIGRLDLGLFAIANRVINGMAGPLLAVCVVTFALPGRRGSRGIAAGSLAGTLASAATCFGVDGLALHYYAVASALATAALACLGFAFEVAPGVARRRG